MADSEAPSAYAAEAGTDAQGTDKPELDEVKIQLWRAMKENVADEITKIVSGDPEMVNADLGHANNPVKAAAYLCTAETMKLLLKLGGKPDARASTEDDTHWTALHKAVTDGNHEMVRVLLDAGADATITWNGQTTLSLAMDQATRTILEEHAAKATATASKVTEGKVISEEADGVVPVTAPAEPTATAAAEPAVEAAASNGTSEAFSAEAAEAAPDASADEPAAETAMAVEPAAAAAVGAAAEEPAVEEPVVVAAAAPAAEATDAPAAVEAQASTVDTMETETDTAEDGPSPKKARVDEPAAEAAAADAPTAAE